MVQVQLRLSQDIVDKLDFKIENGIFKSRSDAIKSILLKYEELNNTREFYRELMKRSVESKDKDNLVDLDDLE
jgi:Arc/MetJ-type ribon-helix-helix transcriptional regulator